MEINTILNLLITYDLTADELLAFYLTFLARDEEGHPEYFAKLFNNGGSKRLRAIFESLKEKGVIKKIIIRERNIIQMKLILINSF